MKEAGYGMVHGLAARACICMAVRRHEGRSNIYQPLTSNNIIVPNSVCHKACMNETINTCNRYVTAAIEVELHSRIAVMPGDHCSQTAT